MKTLIKPLFFALSFGIVASAATFGQSNPGTLPANAATYKTGIYTTTAGKLTISLDKATGGAVDVVLKTSDGHILYSRHLGKNEQTYRTRLNLSDLEDGVYQVEITNGVETTRQSITLSTKLPAAPQRIVMTDAIAAN